MPAGQELHDCALDTNEPLLRDPNRLDIFLQHDLVGRMLEILLLKPDAIPSTPMLVARKDPAVTQEKGADLLLVRPNSLHSDSARADQVPHRFVRWIWHPDRAQLASS